VDTAALNNSVIWLRGHQRQLRLGLMVLFALLCLYFVVMLVRTLVIPAPVVGAEINFSPSAAGNPRWAWYHVAAAPKKEASVAATSNELTKVSIKGELLGVVIAGDHSLATISAGRGAAKVYQLGDEIERNVTLEEVESHRIIVAKSGRRGEILLKDISGKKKSDEKEDLISVKESPPPKAAGNSFGLPGVGKTLPVNIEGEGLGLRLEDISADIADLADLQDGDVVMDINGTPVSDLFTNPALWTQFTRNTNLPMNLIRDGDRQEVYVNAAALFERIIPQLDAGLIQ